MLQEPTYEELEQRIRELESAQKCADRNDSNPVYRLILESISDAVLVTDDSGKITYVCPNTTILFGISESEVYEQIYIDRLMGGSVCDFETIKKDGELKNIEWQITGQNGQIKVLLINVRLVDLPNGSLLYVMRDITDFNATNRRLKEIEKLDAAVINQAPVGIATIDSHSGYFKEINYEYCKIVGYTRSEMLSMDFIQITHPDDLQEDLDNMARLRSGEIASFRMQKRYFRKDGEIVWINLTVVPLGSITGLLIIEHQAS